MVRNDGRDGSGSMVWKSENGDGAKLASKLNKKITVSWNNIKSR
jgi:hypothetical protein